MGFSLLYLVPNKCLCLQSQPDFCRASNIQISLCMCSHPKWSNEYLKKHCIQRKSFALLRRFEHAPAEATLGPQRPTRPTLSRTKGKSVSHFLRRGLPISSSGKFEKATLYAQGDLEGPHPFETHKDS